MTDAEAFLPNRVAVSNDALYNLKPTSCRGRAYRASVPPTNKNSFNPSDTMIFYIPGGRRNTFLDGTQNYLKLTIKNSDTANTLSFDHNGSCVINRIDIFHGSALLETIQAYNVLMNYLYDFNLDLAAGFGIAAMIGCHGGAENDIRSGLILDKSSKNYVTVCIPILSGVIGTSLDKLLPIGQLSDDIRIEISLEGNTTAFCASVVSTTSALTSNAWSIVNAELQLNIIELSDEGMSIINSMTPFNEAIYLHGNSWRHYASSLPASTAGNYSTLVPARFASLKSICLLPRRSTEMGLQNAYSLASRINPGIQNYFFRVGSYLLPNKSVTLKNTSTTYGYAEAFAELQRSFHSLNHAEYAGQISFSSYNVADAADTTIGGGGVIEAGTDVNSYLNAFAMAIELELWNQRSDVMLSGMNTLSQQVFFECNIANMGAASYTLDFYANYDHILVLDPQTGLLSVKY
jgi:hypothetical protein